MTQATTRMNLNHVMLRELSHAQKATENTIPFISMSRTGKPGKTERRFVVAWGRGGTRQYKGSFSGDGNALKPWIPGMDAQL